MVFDSRQIAVPATPFEFIGLDGETYMLPNINTLTGDQARRLRTGEEDSVMAEIADQDVIDAIDHMPVGVQGELSRAWAAYGGSVGKGASRSPGTSTRPRPKRSRST